MNRHFCGSISLAILVALALSACSSPGPAGQATTPPDNSNSVNRSSQNDSTPSEGSSPSDHGEEPDLHGLERVDWPDSREEIALLFTQLPPDIGGLEQGRDFQTDRQYGPDRSIARSPITLSAREVRLMSSTLKQEARSADEAVRDWANPGALAGEPIYDLLGSSWLGIVIDVQVNASGKDRDYRWVQFTSNSVFNLLEVGLRRNAFYNQQVHGLAWGKESGEWVYLAAADSPELLTLGVQALVASAQNDDITFPGLAELVELAEDDPSVWPGFTLYTPDLARVPAAEGVAGLGRVPEITSREQVAAIIGGMPRQLVGQDRFIPLFGPNNPTVYNATYGHRYGPQLNARDVGNRLLISGPGELPEGWTPAHMVVDLVTGPGISELTWGREGGLIWALFKASDGTDEVYGAAWATESGSWVFRITAPAEEERQALLEGFVAASQFQP